MIKYQMRKQYQLKDIVKGEVYEDNKSTSY